MKKIALCVIPALLIGACSTTKETVTPETRPSGSTSAPSSASTSSTAGVGTSSPSGSAVPRPPSSGIPAARAIYFDFDSNAIKDEFTSVVQAHARYLNENRGARLRIEGNTDERGSREYNLALGQRRSDAVKRSLNVLGIAESRVESVSFGEEKPAANGHDESAWKQNRRADLKY
jgi:peptidoglycan-associated lipoprotein